MKKRLLAALLALVMVLGMLPMAAFAAPAGSDALEAAADIKVAEAGAIANTAAFLNYAHDYLGLARSVTTVGNGTGNGTMYVKLSGPLPTGYSLYILVTTVDEEGHNTLINAKYITGPNSLAYWNNEAFEDMDATYNVRVGMWQGTDENDWSMANTYFYIENDDGTASWEKITAENSDRVKPIAVSPVPAFQSYTLAHWMNDFEAAHNGLKSSIDEETGTLTLTAADLLSLQGIVLNQVVFTAAEDTTVMAHATSEQMAEIAAWKALYTTTITKLVATGITTGGAGFGFHWLNVLPGLTEVDFSNSTALMPSTGVLGGDWTAIPNLTKLNLSNTGVKDINALVSAAELTELDVSGNAELTSIAALAGPNGGSGHTGLTKLAKLDISGTGVADINALAFCTNLVELNAASAALTGIQALATCTKLTKLDISGNTGVTGAEALAALAGCTDLAELDISDTQVTALAGLAACTKLEKLTAKGLTNLNVLALQAAVESMTSDHINDLEVGAYDFTGTSKDPSLTVEQKVAVDAMITKLGTKITGLDKYYTFATPEATITVTANDTNVPLGDGEEVEDAQHVKRVNYTVDLPYGVSIADLTVAPAAGTEITLVQWWDHGTSANVTKYDKINGTDDQKTETALTAALTNVAIPAGKTDIAVTIVVRPENPDGVPGQGLNYITYAVTLRLGAPKYMGYTLEEWMTDFANAYGDLTSSISGGTLTLTDTNRAAFLKLWANRHVFDAIEDEVIKTVVNQTQKDQVAAWKAALAAITKLDASGLTAGNELTGIGTLTVLPDLTELDFSNNKISGADGVVPEDALWAQLTKLNLSNAGVKNIDQLATATSLTELDLSGNSITESENEDGDLVGGLNALAACTNLVKLNVSGNTGVTSLNALATCTKLAELNISGTGVTSLNGLANCTKLTSLAAADLTGLNVLGLATAVGKMTDTEIDTLATGAYVFTGSTKDEALTRAEKVAVNHVIEVLGDKITGLAPYTLPAPTATISVTAGSTAVTLGTADVGDTEGYPDPHRIAYNNVEIPSNRTATITVTPDDGFEVTKVLWYQETQVTKYDKNGDTLNTAADLTAALTNIPVTETGNGIDIVVRPVGEISDNYTIYIVRLVQGEAAEEPPAPPASTTTTTPSAASYKVTNGSGSSENGSWSTDKTSAEEGDTVTITVTPNDGYTGTPTVTDKDGNAVAVTSLGDNKFSFVMPAAQVTVSVEFTAAAARENPFVDVAEDEYYYEAVLWAVENGITDGTSDTTFSPKATCTRAQAVTFLWRAAGSPAPTSTENPFTDIQPGDYYYDAVLWAVENGITNGTSADKFSPNATVTRAQTVTFLYRAAKAQATEGDNPFADVAEGEYYYEAVLWAVENGITNGTSAGKFSPAPGCNRAQMVTFLYRYMA